MRQACRAFAILAVMLVSASALARSRHADPTVTKCAGGCRVKIPIQNLDGYKTVHAWAVPTAVGGPSRTNILQPPSGIPGAQYLGTLEMNGKGNFEIDAMINADGGNFAKGSQLRIFTGYIHQGGVSAHVWGASMTPFAMEVGP